MVMLLAIPDNIPDDKAMEYAHSRLAEMVKSFVKSKIKAKKTTTKKKDVK